MKSCLDRGLQQIQHAVSALLVEARLDGRPLTPADLEDVRTLAQPKSAGSGATLAWENSLAGPVPLPANLVRQLLLNLMLNARQAVDPGGRVAVQIAHARGGLQILVENSGEPIPPIGSRACSSPTRPRIRIARDLGSGCAGRSSLSSAGPSRPRRWSAVRACACTCPACRSPTMTEPRPRICLVEDDPIMGEALAERLDLEGFQVRWHHTGLAALPDLTGGTIAIAVIDIRLPDCSGITLFERIGREAQRPPPCVFITGCGNIEDAVRLLKLGAADYLTKPLDPTALVDKLRILVRETDQARSRETAGAAAGLALDAGALGAPLGISPAMRRVEEQLVRIASHPATPLLISGESGVGKELVAQRLHALQCPNDPLVAVNCAALPESLIEAELFGHEKGAYTGAERRRAGVFERAGTGILFLDEIGDMPLSLQSRLLRVLQSRSLTRIGAGLKAQAQSGERAAIGPTPSLICFSMCSLCEQFPDLG
ncbi:sigma 54-interacting transcriptional regulator [uncultured Thiodictyon sp.]|jgi:FixJ family two-component response regulator|uniref:sigma 54-interacting transcriptional regulator n=1 Tax=uncultured Thiodictyon sp. TaxID=1846217 RepID=UPI00260050EC|nr:sigma 54-interacting transcriptional regulator [uncultured Thiodictyon sp.]